MSIALSATYSLTQATGGLVVGTLLDHAIPKFSEDEPLEQTIALLSLQAVINGGAVATGMYLFNRGGADPTGGLLFIWSLIMTQPGLSDRISLLSSALGQHAKQLAPSAVAALSGAGARCPAE
jgi:hypothetical protein